MLLREEDLVISASTNQHLRTLLSRKRRYSELTKTGRGQWVIPNNEHIEMDDSLSSASVARFMVAYRNHADYVVKNIKALALEHLATNERSTYPYGTSMKLPVSFAGITSYWSPSEFNEFVGITDDAIEQHFGGLFSRYEQDLDNSSPYWVFKSLAPKDSSLISQAYIDARMALMSGSLSSFTYDPNRSEQRVWIGQVRLTVERGSTSHFVPLTGYWELLTAYNGLTGQVSGKAVFNARNQILSARRVEAADRERVARQVSRDNFTKYWSSLKQVMKTAVDAEEVHSSWNAVPISPKGTISSRTWGIEIETIRADLVSRPAGWDERSDGSLSSMDGCDCECDDCCDGNHCGYDGCGDDDDSCAEFVSPILRHFNSDGLRNLCTPLDGTRVNETPGIHVHVGADDLSVTDVARLIRAYSAISPYLEPISYRQSRGYCADVSTGNVTYWLAASREHMKRTSSDRAVDVSGYQPDNRYHDLNLIALQAHGTIEFRVMGPHYNYDHLVRWAWFCREMVNLCKLDIPQSTWTGVRSMADILVILNQYGSETTYGAWLQASDELVAEAISESAND